MPTPCYAWFRGRRVMLPANDPGYLDRLEAAEALRDAFIAETGYRVANWSVHNLSRLLRATGERPERVDAMRALLCALGMGEHGAMTRYRWIGMGGVFDHGDMWSWSRRPWAITGHPYHITDDQHALTAELARFGTLRVAIDDRPSFYGFGTHHFRVELLEPRVPFDKLRATRKTREAARAARKAFAEVGLVKPMQPAEAN